MHANIEHATGKISAEIWQQVAHNWTFGILLKSSGNRHLHQIIFKKVMAVIDLLSQINFFLFSLNLKITLYKRKSVNFSQFYNIYI